MGSETFMRPKGKMKVTSEMPWWLIVQSNRGGDVRG